MQGWRGGMLHMLYMLMICNDGHFPADPRILSRFGIGMLRLVSACKAKP